LRMQVGWGRSRSPVASGRVLRVAMERGRLPRTVMALCLWCLLLVVGISSALPVWAQSGSGATRPSAVFPDMFRLSPAIPGTSEYEMQQKAAELEAVLADLDAIVSARVSLRKATGEAETPAAAVQLELTAEEAWSAQLSQTVVALVSQLEPALTTEAILITDRQGHILFDNGRDAIPPALAPEPEAEPTALVQTLSGTAAIAVGLALGLVVVLGWWLFGARPTWRVRREPSAPEGPWTFLATVERSKLKRVLGAQRPELVGAIAAQLDEHTAARLRPVLRAVGHPAMPAPDRAMHHDIADALAARIRQMLAEEE